MPTNAATLASSIVHHTYRWNALAPVVWTSLLCPFVLMPAALCAVVGCTSPRALRVTMLLLVVYGVLYLTSNGILRLRTVAQLIHELWHFADDDSGSGRAALVRTLLLIPVNYLQPVLPLAAMLMCCIDARVRLLARSPYRALLSGQRFFFVRLSWRVMVVLLGLCCVALRCVVLLHD